MTGWVAMVPGTLGDGAGRCREVSRQARLVVANVGGLPQPAGMPAHVSGSAARRDGTAAAQRRLGRGAVGVAHPPFAQGPDRQRPDGVAAGRHGTAARHALGDAATAPAATSGPGPEREPEARSARASLAKVPGGNLKVHEARGGHTLLKHVNKTVGDLRARLRSEPWLKTASAFTNREIAEDAVQGVLKMNGPTIKSKLIFQDGEAVLVQSFNRAIGNVVTRDGVVRASKQITVVLVKDASKLGHHVKTAFPS
jgi:ribosomal 50S subunit-recycling heat shock protein